MNKIWSALMIICSAVLLIVSPANIPNALLDGTGNALKFLIKLLPIYCAWQGVFQLLEDSGATDFLVKLFRPLFRKIYVGASDESIKNVSLNFSANLLGLGAIATPMGINAVRSMGDGSGRATKNQVTFAVMNSTALSLFPTTVISLRIASGSLTPGDIILPTVIVSITMMTLGVFATKVLY